VTRAELLVLLGLLETFDAQIASDEPAHLACVILAMHCNVLLEVSQGLESSSC
jgi:hypothetical protein